MESSFSLEGTTLTRRHCYGDVVAESIIELDEPPRSTDDLLGVWLSAHLHGKRPASTRNTRTVVRTVDLFCGPGGLGLGFQRACDELGIDMVSNAAVDQDAEALQVYTANHATRRRSSESVSTLVDYQVMGQGEDAEFVYDPEVTHDDWVDLVGRTDVILAGPPCQGHSNLNNKTRRNDRRNELYLTVPAMALALQAPVVIIENVPAVIHDRQQVVGSTISILEQAGYTVARGVLRADRMGWAQTRQRYFLVARLDEAPVPIDVVAAALQADPHDVTWAIGDLAKRPHDDRLHLATEMSAENTRRIEYLFEKDLHDLPPSERPDCHKDGTTYNAVYGRMYPHKPAPTITTGFMTPGRGRYIHPTEHRVLTPWEAARIQGFPDGYVFHADPSRPPSKAKLAKWIGDAVPMPLGHAAGLAALLPGWASR
jgi:DNA (cytosine-5)-methyltransferase 1